ncbi:hypothetical protein [Thiohalomonas denitrificans]|uniref:hypothetical protein n=1 Tax=Thiohalomonas denitrificans TaxID=415747 RepID=UPI0011134919|nr:hypothetical protein [Thiohalomonas denitrificans]
MNTGKYLGFFIVLIAFALLLVSGQTNADQYAGQTIVFAPDKTNEKPVILSFQGKLYQRNATFERLQKRGAEPTREEMFVINLVETNRSGTEEQILSLWKPSERSAMRKQVSNPRMFNRNRSLYKNIKTSSFVAMVNYGDFVLSYVEHELRGAGPYLKMYPLFVSGKDVYLSNALMGDFFYEKIASQLGDYLASKKQK